MEFSSAIFFNSIQRKYSVFYNVSSKASCISLRGIQASQKRIHNQRSIGLWRLSWYHLFLTSFSYKKISSAEKKSPTLVTHFHGIGWSEGEYIYSLLTTVRNCSRACSYDILELNFRPKVCKSVYCWNHISTNLSLFWKAWVALLLPKRFQITRFFRSKRF